MLQGALRASPPTGQSALSAIVPSPKRGEMSWSDRPSRNSLQPATHSHARRPHPPETAPCPATAGGARNDRDGPDCSEFYRPAAPHRPPADSSPANRPRDLHRCVAVFRPAPRNRAAYRRRFAPRPLPASANWLTCSTVASTLLVFVAHMLCTTIGHPPPIVTEPTLTGRVGLRGSDRFEDSRTDILSTAYRFGITLGFPDVWKDFFVAINRARYIATTHAWQGILHSFESMLTQCCCLSVDKGQSPKTFELGNHHVEFGVVDLAGRQIYAIDIR